MKNIYDLLNDSEQYDENIERVELTDIEKRKILKHVTGKSTRKWGSKRMMAVAAFAAVLVVGTSAYAAVKHIGLVDYYAGNRVNLPREEVEKLVDTDVQQKLVSSDVADDALVNFNIREALCDDNQLVVEVEAVPTDPEHYILAPEDCALDCPVTELLMEGVTEGTVGEYIESQGKEVLNVGAMIVDDSIAENSLDFVREKDGTLIIVIDCGNTIKKNNMNLTCRTTYRNVNDSSIDGGVVQSEFAFQVTDESNAKKFVYVPDEAVASEDTYGSMLDELVVNQTELTMGITAKWHLTKPLSEKERSEDYSMTFHIYTEDGTELRFIRDGGQGEIGSQLADGTWELEHTYVYETINLPDTLIVEAYDYDKAEVVGKYTVHLKK
ncbi:MAG: hypothetical protein J1E62_10690 [Lachnospiraceae bacterium]|nr:hypothetical protein [Lachnospiraceae bacterium]